MQWSIQEINHWESIWVKELMYQLCVVQSIDHTQSEPRVVAHPIDHRGNSRIKESRGWPCVVQSINPIQPKPLTVVHCPSNRPRGVQLQKSVKDGSNVPTGMSGPSNIPHPVQAHVVMKPSNHYKSSQVLAHLGYMMQPSNYHSHTSCLDTNKAVTVVVMRHSEKHMKCACIVK